MSRKKIRITRGDSLSPHKAHRSFSIDYRNELNSEQFEAVTYIHGPLLVIAGAGSGKTRVITYRTAFLAENSIPPDKIVLLTFTRKAAREMLSRAQALSGLNLSSVEGGTFHSFAHKLLRRYGEYIGLNRNFALMDQSDSTDAVKTVRDRLGLGSKEKRFPNKNTLFTTISKSRNKGLSIEQIVASEWPQFMDDLPGIERVAHEYEALKRSRNLLDFDDLLFFLRDLLQSPQGKTLVAKYEHVMADEYQDTNGVQAEIVRLLASGHNNVCVVGDDAQCIYTWRGSSFENILNLENVFPNLKVVKLVRNYRSTQPILDVANKVISKATRSYTKVLRTTKKGGERPWLVYVDSPNAQADLIAAKVLELREQGVELKDMAVLCRAVWHLRDLELELNRRNIPYVVFGGLKFSEAAHVKDLLAFLRFALNPQDDLSLKRVVELIPRVGPATSAKVIAAVTTRNEPFAVLSNLDLKIPASTRETFGKMAQTFTSIAAGNRSPAEYVEEVNRLYQPLLKEKFDDYSKRERDLEQVASLAVSYSSLSAFITDMALEPNRDRSQDDTVDLEDDDEHLVLSTIHSAKGLEFNSVFIPHLVDGLFPSNRSYGDPEALEEERRLFYVAVTRAKEDLFLCHPVFVPGPHNWDSGAGITNVSRFIDDEVEELVDSIDVEWD